VVVAHSGGAHASVPCALWAMTTSLLVPCVGCCAGLTLSNARLRVMKPGSNKVAAVAQRGGLLFTHKVKRGSDRVLATRTCARAHPAHTHGGRTHKPSRTPPPHTHTHTVSLYTHTHTAGLLRTSHTRHQPLARASAGATACRRHYPTTTPARCGPRAACQLVVYRNRNSRLGTSSSASRD
jgi:hypothetical protein